MATTVTRVERLGARVLRITGKVDSQQVVLAVDASEVDPLQGLNAGQKLAWAKAQLTAQVPSVTDLGISG